METSVGKIVRKKFIALKKSDSLYKAIGIFTKNPDMVFPVVDKKGRIIGEVNQHELLKLAVPGKYIDGDKILGPGGIKSVLARSAKKVEDIMTTNDIKIKEDTNILNVAKIMLETEVRTLEVLDKDSKPIGFVSELDILKHLQKKLKPKKKKK